MNLMGFSGGQYCPLSPEQIETVHEASLKILKKTGLTYEQGLEDTVQMLEDNGAVIDRDRKNITFPGSLIIEQALTFWTLKPVRSGPRPLKIYTKCHGWWINWITSIFW